MAFPQYGISAAEMRAACGLAVGDTSEDTILEQKVLQAIKIFENLCGGRKFVTTTASRYYGRDSFEGRYLYLDDELYTLTGGYVKNGDASATSITTSELDLLPLNDGPPYDMIWWPDGATTWQIAGDGYYIEVKGDWGFSSSPPTDVEDAVLLLGQFYYTLKDSNPTESVTLANGQQIVVRRGIPKDVWDVIATRKRVGRGVGNLGGLV